jgi:CheY-like chemotaxis protein
MAKVTKSRNRPAQSGRENTLGAQGRLLDELLDELDGGGCANVHRSHSRWSFRERSIRAMLRQPDGGEVELALAARNLSVGGVSLLHSAFVYPGTVITVDLPRADKKIQRVNGQVMRCDHVRGVIHELGVKFEEAINLRDFQAADPFSETFSYENIDLSQLRGTVVHIDPSQIDRQIVRHLLKDTALSIRGCETLEEARPYIDKGCDLILAEFNMPDSDGAMLASLLRSEGHTMPIVIASSSTTKTTLDMIKRASVDVFIAKPIEEGRLIAAIAEYLAPESAYQDQKAAGLDEGMRELAAMFSSGLGDYADRLEKAIEADETDEMFGIATQMKGSALALGFEKIGMCSTEVVQAIDENERKETLNRVVRKLIMACRTARPVV